MNYDYTAINKRCADLGLYLHEGLVKEFDYKANLNGLTQAQVEFVLIEHLAQIKMAFTPSIYSFKHRVLLALYFLTGYLKNASR